jgi:sulfite reductase alpha subunit-like flavoprotein
MSGAAIREFLRELFGSRTVARLEFDIERMRADCEERIREYKLQLLELTQEKSLLQSKMLQYENVIMPLSSKAGADLKKPSRQPSFITPFEDAPKTSWQLKQEEFDRIQNEPETGAKDTANV